MILYAKKSLGQNFLIDKNIIKKISNLTSITNKDIIEIGPGNGALTNQLLSKRPRSITLIEKDNSLFLNLKKKYENIKKIKIFNRDILEFDLEKICKKNSIIFGNLPFNISSQILTKILKFKKFPPNYTSLVFMFQKELAERVVGKFKTSKYGRLSIITNFSLFVHDKFNVSPNCFFPRPKVVSTVLHLKPHRTRYVKLKNLKNLEFITQIFFSNKRKMVNKNINKIFSYEDKMNIFKKIDYKSRPSDISPHQFYEIAKLFEEKN